jgi:hypothetical protein
MNGRNQFEKPKVETYLTDTTIRVQETDNPDGWIRIDAESTVRPTQ